MLTRSRALLIRLHSTKPPGALSQRLEDLESQYPATNDPLLGDAHKSLIDKDDRLSSIAKEMDQKKFELENQISIQATKVPLYADKQTREVAHSSPWTGSETPIAASKRMLQDTYKPLRKTPAQKLLKAREAALDFKLNKTDEESTFRTIYAEKFTPIGSFDKIKTLADARIEEAMRQGQFEGIPRGKKLDTEVKPYVDRTEHHLNEMLKRQNCVPPWIEKQGGVNVEIDEFRKEIREKWESHVRHFYKDEGMQQEFKRRWGQMLERKMVLVNNSIRTYNLQAPMSTQKFYLLIDKEYQRCFNSVDVQKVLKEKEQEKQQDVPLKKESKGILGFLGWR